MDINTNFIEGKMNKSVDERLIPPGQYIDAQNVRLGSTESTEIGAVENSKGNTLLTDIAYLGSSLSSSATCIGAFEDGVNENIYWFVHDPLSPVSSSGKVDLILSYNTTNQLTTYHVISETILNFNPQYLITGISLLEDLLFFTDDYNAPRKINITRNYPEPLPGGDQITNEELNVIVKPPGFSSYNTSLGVTTYELSAPTLNLVNVIGDENYIKDKFICFAYRYQYRENEYSATSLFTTPAFEPGQFIYDKANQNNEGMENIFNSVDVTFNTGGPLVIAIELLFKESATNTINVIERFVKDQLGWSDNNQQTFRFTNSKIYTVLGSDELLRLYDNVPRFAQAQTIMGNRLIYGNYIDQYNVTTAEGQQIPIDFVTTGSSQGVENITVPFDLLGIGDANKIDSTSGGVSVPFSYGRWNLPTSTIPLPIVKFSEFNVQVKITSTTAYASGASGYLPLGGDTSNPLFPTGFATNTLSSQPVISVRIIARDNYATYVDFTNSLEFQEAFGVGVPGSTGSTITPITPGATYGFSLSDQFYALIQPPITPAYPVNYVFKTAGLWDPGTGAPVPAQEGYKIGSFSTGVRIQQPSVQYQYDDGLGTVVNVYEYFAFSFTDITVVGPPAVGSSTDCTLGYTNISNSKSLHSNRNFETGIMYIDDFGRSTTVLVSPNNTVFFPASDSISINTIIATINNKPPFWASRYKFFIKPSLGAYNIVYSDSIFTDQFDQGLAWVRLEGDATAIVNKNDILTVKIQSDGQAIPRLVTTTVLEIEAKSRGGTETGEDNNLPSGAPAGLYMLIRPQGFRAQTSINALIDNGYESLKTSSGYGTLSYPCFTTDDTGVVVFDLPTGASVQMTFRAWRGYAYFAKCDLNIETVPFRFEVTASSYAQNFKDFFDQEGLNPANFMQNTECIDAEAVYYPTPYTIGDGPYAGPVNTLQFWFTSDDYSSDSSELFLNIRSTTSPVSGPFGLDFRPVNTEAQITVNRNNNFMAFETKPAVADADLFYESSESYSIKQDINGDLAHFSNDKTGSQNQVISTNTPAIVTLPFSDCYTFGNGIESFRYKDLSTSNFFVVGERVSAVSNSLFEEADRFAGLTYSGVFSGPSNVNNLNEFNLGLVNFKDCELVFGPIMKLHARQTDILVLQEDRISYVLSNKNLISDSTGGGAIVSTPTILGLQIARIEEYGISFNPESFTSWGRDMYFSDTKRGAVIKLSGAGAESDSLEVVSTFGMRSYFRDKFIDQLTTQKLGGYDPYMNEYVFSSNNISIPASHPLTPCGAQIEQLNTTTSLVLNIDVTTSIGDFVWKIVPMGSTDINVVIEWNNNISTTNNITSATSITINKTSSYPSSAKVTITPNSTSSYRFIPACVSTKVLNVVSVVLGSPISGLVGTGAQTIHYEYSWNNGSFSSPTSSEQVTFSGISNFSNYTIDTGQSSLGLFPANGSTITMRSNKINPDTFTFSDTENRFYAITSTSLPASSEATFDLTLLTNPITPIVGSNPDSVNNVDQIYTAISSPITISPTTQTLYLVWDFRDRRNEDMCYSTIDAVDACTGCVPLPNCTDFNASDVQSLFVDACNGGAGIGMRGGDYYHDGTNVLPVAGDQIYQTAGPNPLTPCNQGVVAAMGYYYLSSGDVMFIQGNTTGIVTSIIPCP